MADKRVLIMDEFQFQKNVLDRITDAARAAIGVGGSKGDRYILTDGANINKIAYISVAGESPTWVYLTPTEGYIAWVNDENEYYKFDGTNWSMYLGEKGDQGDQGATGAKGDQGDQGATGAKGDQGDQGATGAKGDQGDQGATGAKGDQGDQGAAGPAAVYDADYGCLIISAE